MSRATFAWFRSAVVTAAVAAIVGIAPARAATPIPLTASLTAATPVAVWSQSPQAVVAALLATPFADAELPKGMAGATVGPWPADDEDLTGTVGGVAVALAGDRYAAIGYLVYSDAATAQRALDGARADAGTAVATPVGFAYPAAVWSDDGYAVCTVLVGNVVVTAGLLGAADAAPQETADQATALAQAGVAHLLRVLAP